MRRYIYVILALLLLLPILTIFVFDARYGALQDSICKKYPHVDTVGYACNFPERNERERIVTTAFYRHIADYFGREEGTSPSWLDDAAAYDDDGYEIKHEIGVFNRELVSVMIFATITASISGTLLTQKALDMYRRKHN